MNSPNIILLTEDETIALYRVQSESTDNMTYGVDIDKEEGTVFCDCPDFRYRKQTEKWGGARLDDHTHHCKHIKQILEAK